MRPCPPTTGEGSDGEGTVAGGPGKRYRKKPTRGVIYRPVAVAAAILVAACSPSPVPSNQSEGAAASQAAVSDTVPSNQSQGAAASQEAAISDAVPSIPLTIAIATSISGGASPVITGTTNLPDGTILWAQIMPPHPQCMPTCTAYAPAGVDFEAWGGAVTVEHGTFTIGPDWQHAGDPWLREDGSPGLHGGTYVLEVRIPPGENDTPHAEPVSVQRVLGVHEENARGPLVGGCCFAEASLYGEAQAERDVPAYAAYERDPTVGPEIYYARYFEVP